LHSTPKHDAEIFVGVLGASSYTYAEPSFTQTLPDWNNARAGIDDCNPLARIINKHFIAGRMMLAQPEAA
jgi:hypothetical protein